MTDHDLDIINHSVGWIWSGPGDGTSPYSNSPLRTVDAAVAGWYHLGQFRRKFGDRDLVWQFQRLR